jgi:hypothetical protein
MTFANQTLETEKWVSRSFQGPTLQILMWSDANHARACMYIVITKTDLDGGTLPHSSIMALLISAPWGCHPCPLMLVALEGRRLVEIPYKSRINDIPFSIAPDTLQHLPVILTSPTWIGRH